MLKQQHHVMLAMLAVADGLVVMTAAFAAWVVRKVLIVPISGFQPGDSVRPRTLGEVFASPLDGYAPRGDYPFWPTAWENYFKQPLLLAALLCCMVSFYAFKLYRPRRDRSLAGELAQVAKAVVIAVMAMVVVLWGVGSSQLAGGNIPSRPLLVLGFELDANRVQMILLAVFLLAGMTLHRATFRMVLRHLRSRGLNLRHVAIIGVGRTGRIAAQTLGRNTWTGLRVAYFISHKHENRLAECMGLPVLGGLRDLEHTLSHCKVDAVYLALPSREAPATGRILRRLERFPVDVRIIPDVNSRFVQQSMAVHELDGMPVLSYRESPMHGLGGACKRAVDLLGASAAMLVLMPVMLACALAVRLSGPGPVVFRQRRVGLGGEVFWMYKFRTMHHADEEAAELLYAAARASDGRDELDADRGEDGWTRRDDPRITPVGRLLRRTSLDELPQLLNVLRGEMSLVGPRPERPELIERFREDWRGYMLRQHVKAGMTGWAQINGLRGDTSLRRRLRYDLYYVRHWSLLFDLRILAMTPLRGFIHRNAH
ncbi:MAG: undecaprenyl-phosphate glucose phosphotransferase [Phycisphaeraceae bacterium]|nr:undecaprenyl-phosphate glucose phosphotransferase [Phycisphaeraceae bacterium]